MSQTPQTFGFLNKKIEGSFFGGHIKVLPHFEDSLTWINKNSNSDGYLYPLTVETYKLDLKNPEKRTKIKNTMRPACVFHLPDSHEVTIQSPTCKFNSAFADEALIVYLLSFLFGTRLQLAQWGFDGRVPIKPANNIYITDKTVFNFIGHVYQWWLNLDDALKVKFVNIIYVFNRARSLEWSWDAFQQQYIVFDALFHLYKNTNNLPKQPSHRGRFDLLFAAYGIKENNEIVDKIYLQRNDLFHEAIWSGTTIGFGSANQEAYYFPSHLARINERIICGMVKYNNEFSKSVWCAMGTFEFGLAK